MILQSLYAYYQQLAVSNTAELPPLGYEAKPIPFTLVIDASGNYVSLQDNRGQDKKEVKSFLVPQSQIRSGSASYKQSNCLWDHYGYVLGQPKPADTAVAQEKNIEMAKRQFASFLAKTEEIAAATHDPDVEAIVKFLQNPQAINAVKQSPNYQDMLKINGCNIAFKLAGKGHLICQNESVINYCTKQAAPDTKEGVCLISGKKGPIARLHLPISGICSQPAPLSSINDDAYCSYGQKQGFNFPVSVIADFQSSKALDYLLRRNSPQKIFWSGSSTTMIFWADKQSSGAELLFGLLREDSSAHAADQIKALYASIHNGIYIGPDKDISFYLLGLQPNAKRIAVKFWYTGSIGGIAANIVQWLNDICLDHATNDRVQLSAILKSIVNSRIKNDAAKYGSLYECTLRAILQNTALPSQLLKNALIRINAEQGKVTAPRAALIKAYLNRRRRAAQEEDLTMSLNLNETSPGYLLGRLMAVLEKLQKDANPGLNSTIKDRYYASASITPKAVFSTLMRLHNYHLQKLKGQNSTVYYNKLIAEILDQLQCIPAHLDLDNQGLFALGYYQQQKDLYTKKEQ